MVRGREARAPILAGAMPSHRIERDSVLGEVSTMTTEATQSPCPLCASSSIRFKQIRSLGIHRCSGCGHFFHPVDRPLEHIKSVYSDNYFSHSSEGYQDYLQEEPNQRRSAKFYCGLISKYCSSPGALLDIGAASGFFLDEFQKLGWQGQGVEPNQRMRNVALDRFKLPMVEALEQVSEASPFQLVTMIQVISHLLDPVASLQRVHRALDRNGLLLIETWDRDSWIAKLSGNGWHEWNPPSVVHWFSRSSLRSVLESVGFEEVCSGIPRKRIQLGRAVAMLRHSWKDSLAMRCVTTPLRIVPAGLSLPYLLGDAFWLLLRKK